MKTLLLMSAVLLCGCASSRTLEPMPDDISSYRYYVIDANSDIPDANFTSFEEAAVYQKEYAEYHDYVIVKIDERYNVYNMEPFLAE
jgi:hypothetical protein